jgi:3-hydroxy-5-methyl-1-naphthoate 3-O-methyltransferase
MIVDLTRAPMTDPTPVYRYRDGLYAVDLLTTAVTEFDIFTWLADHPSDFEAFCRRFDFRPRPADVLVTLCVAMGLLVRSEGRLHVTELAREHLAAPSPWNLSAYYASLKDRPVARDFARVLRTNRPAQWGADRTGSDWHAAMETEAFAQTFTAAMDARGLLLGEALTRAVDLRWGHRLLDIGGGSGIYACAFAARHSHLMATVVEQPPVGAIAERLIRDRGFADRVRVHTANILTQAWPPRHDVHLFSNVLHDWDEPVVRQLLARSFDALEPGGLLIVHEAFIDADKTGPLPVAEYSALLMHSTQGKCYATSEYDRFFAEAGFVVSTFTETVADRGVMTARKPG